MAKNQTVVFDGVTVDLKTTQLQTESGLKTSRTIGHAPITIFAIPKAFTGESARIQRNAIQSWMQLSPAVDVLLFGDEAGIGEFADDVGALHESELQRNEQGTPLVSSAFAQVCELTTSPIVVYCNADVILGPDFVQAIEQLSEQKELDQWLAIGQRTDLCVDCKIDFEDSDQVNSLWQNGETNGVVSSRVCKEFFAFPRELFREIPAFAVGRGNWDNWVVANAKAQNVPVIDLSKKTTVLHQSHNYLHLKASRMSCYVNGAEAIENQRLAKGRNLISGSTCTHRLRDSGVQKIGAAEAAFDFLVDLPRFAKLMVQLLSGRS